jgi:hypothetical protein
MPLQELAPGAIAQLGCPRGRADDVREENGREDPVGLGLPRLARHNVLHEGFELGQQAVRFP